MVVGEPRAFHFDSCTSALGLRSNTEWFLIVMSFVQHVDPNIVSSLGEEFGRLSGAEQDGQVSRPKPVRQEQ